MVSNDYIRGFFDGEGSVALYKTRGNLHPYLRITNTAILPLLQIKESLVSQGFHPTLVIRKPPINKRWKQVYTLQLLRWEEVVRFYHVISTGLLKHQATFEEIEALNRVRRHHFPPESIEATLQMLGEKMRGNLRGS